MKFKVLIFTVYKNLESFQRRVDNRTLLWGLDEANIDWEFHHPWKPLPDLSQFDAVYSSFYSPHFYNFVFYCKKAEEKCREYGIPVINSAENFNPGHSYFLRKWREQNIPCPRFQNFADFDDVKLNYPMILRVDGVHRGLSMRFAESEEEARNYIAEQSIEEEPFNMAIEFIDTRNDEGFYEKRRCYVVGDTVIPAHFLRSKNRFVNYKDSLLDPYTCLRDGEYINEIEDAFDAELLLKAAKATGFEIITLDYSINQNGDYFFWEGNRLRGTAGDDRIKWLGIRPPDMQYGNAVTKLITEKIENYRSIKTI